MAKDYTYWLSFIKSLRFYCIKCSIFILCHLHSEQVFCIFPFWYLKTQDWSRSLLTTTIYLKTPLSMTCQRKQKACVVVVTEPHQYMQANLSQLQRTPRKRKYVKQNCCLNWTNASGKIGFVLACCILTNFPVNRTPVNWNICNFPPPSRFRLLSIYCGALTPHC